MLGDGGGGLKVKKKKQEYSIKNYKNKKIKNFKIKTIQILIKTKEKKIKKFIIIFKFLIFLFL